MIQRATQTRQFGPADHGRRLSYVEFMAGDYQPGYKYELINGELYVSPLPRPGHSLVQEWIWFQLKLYARLHPKVINSVSGAARVFVPARHNITAPEPDVAAFRGFPVNTPADQIRWQDHSPLLVVEVLSPDNADKDLERNVALYLEVPSIKEYWLFDTREDADYPTLTVHRRRGSKWRIINIAPGETYSTRLLPGFELVNDRFR
jgi:Uma2 family endonuclease